MTAGADPSTNLRAGSEEVLLEAKSLILREGAEAFDFLLRAGEIVGLAGLEGHGQQDFLWSLCGLGSSVGGRITVTRPTRSKPEQVKNLRQAARLGVAYVPRDRKSDALLSTMSVVDNFALPTLRQDTRGGVVRKRHQTARYMEYSQRVQVKASSPEAPISTLSGGNQQKVILARWMAARPQILLLDDPTRGVDANTKRTLYEVFSHLASVSTGLVLLSTEIEELVLICTRVLVFLDGAPRASLSGDSLTYTRVIDAMFGRVSS